MSFIDILLKGDLSLFYWINRDLGRSWLDPVFIFLTELKFFIIPIAFVIGALLTIGGRKGRLMVVALLLAVLLADQISAHCIKPWVRRTRPCNVLPDDRTPYGKSSALSFPSSHATNIAAVMMVLGLGFTEWSWAFALWAFLVGLSRIYLGLHYPTDVLGGWVLGAVLGWISWSLVFHVGSPWEKNEERPVEDKRGLIH